MVDRIENALSLRSGRLDVTEPDRPRDKEAARMLATGHSLPEICQTLGYPDESRTLDGVKRAMALAVRFARDEYRYMELLGLDEIELRLWKLLEKSMPLVDRGQVVRGMDGHVIDDLRFDKEVMDEIRKTKAQRAKLLGLNAPTRSEVVSIDLVEAEISRLEAEVHRHIEYSE